MGYRLERQGAPTREALVTLGSVFVELRRSRGLTQRGLAWRSGLSQSSISRLETGKAPWLRAVWIARLLAGLDLGRDELGLRPQPGSSPEGGWVLLMRRFGAARRRRELLAIAAAKSTIKEQALLDLPCELGGPTDRPP